MQLKNSKPVTDLNPNQFQDFGYVILFLYKIRNCSVKVELLLNMLSI